MAVVNGEKNDQGVVDKGKEDLPKHLLARDPKGSMALATAVSKSAKAAVEPRGYKDSEGF